MAQGTLAFTASTWVTHAHVCRAHGLRLLQPSKSLLLTACVTLWATRLGGYLFARVCQLGKDKRLDIFFPKDAGEPWLTGPAK